MVYEFGPDGTQFAEPVQMTIVYDPGAVPEGIDESSLRLNKLEGDDWQSVSESTVNTEDSTVSGLVNSFSVFGVLGTAGEEPAAFDCSTVTTIPTVECEALVALYTSTDGDNWHDDTGDTGWLLSADPCSWFRIMHYFLTFIIEA